MKIKTTSTFTLEPEEAAALGTVVDLLIEMKEEIDIYSNLIVEGVSIPFSTLNKTAQFLDHLWAIGSASVSTANYEEDDERLSFDGFEEGNKDYDGHNDEV